jgi:septal ring factor EnvC (AmiA/AmiB activator)
MKNETAGHESDTVFDQLRQHQEAIAQIRQTLHEECQKLDHLLNDLNKYQSTHDQCLAELDVLRMGNEYLQQMVAERDAHLEKLTQQQPAFAPETPQSPEAGAILAEVVALREQLQEKEVLIAGLRGASQESPAASALTDGDGDYEAELTEFRRQLEADRRELNEEIQQLRARNAELNEVVRETELQLSRERAQLARERVQLDRLREEIRQELERAQRTADVRERLAAVERLKEQVTERNRPAGIGSAAASSSAPQSNGSTLARWRSRLSG